MRRGNAMVEYPIDFRSLIDGGNITPGSPIYLMSDIPGDFSLSWIGTAEAPITILPYDNRRIQITGRWTVGGQHIHIHNLEFTATWEGYNRDALSGDDSDPQIGGIQLGGSGNKVIGCIIHDFGGGGSWQSNVGGGMIDCLIYNSGWRGADEVGRGHCLYTQNEFATQTHDNCIMWGAYNYGFHAYTEGGLINNFRVTRIISYLNAARQFAAGGLGGQRVHDSVFDDIYTYPGATDHLKASDSSMTNSYFGGRAINLHASSVNVTMTNTAYDTVGYGDPEPTSGQVIKVFPCQNTERAHAAVFNWDQSDSAVLDLTAVTGIGEGDTVRIHNAQDYFADYDDITVSETGTVTVDMRAASHTVAARVGSTSSITKSFPKFGAFVL